MNKHAISHITSSTSMNYLFIHNNMNKPLLKHFLHRTLFLCTYTFKNIMNSRYEKVKKNIQKYNTHDTDNF